MADTVKPLPFAFDGWEVYNADDLRDYDSNFFYGCSRGIRKIIERKKIDDSDYKWGTKTKNGWKTCSQECPKGKLLLKAEWVHDNVPKMAVNKDVKYEYEEAPNVLHLDEEEKFKDINGVSLDIEVRGERHEDKVYFKVKDVSKAFDMEGLYRIIIDKHTKYEENIEYKYFIQHNVKTFENDTSKKVHKKTLYLTYSGMLRVLFASYSKNAHKFRKWATEKLFTLQMGTKEQKQALVSDALGVTVAAVREVFKKSSTSVPCVYLFAFGTVGDLRTTMSIDTKFNDDDVVYKYGMTKDLVSRTQQHQADYGKINGVTLKLKYYSFIDPQYVSEAETDIRTFFNSLDMKLEYDNRSELVVIKSQHIEIVKKQYQNLSMLYAGHIKELVQKIKDLEKDLEMRDERHNNALKLKDERYNNIIELNKVKYEAEINTYKLEVQMRDERIQHLEQVRDLEHKLLKAQGITI
jgi:hypothetical protein